MKKTAFTLIELLVVISVIGLLMSFLVPVIGKVRNSAKRVACANNLRQIGLAFSMYIDEHNSKFPLAGVPPGGNYGGPWFGNIYPYLDNQNVRNCPSYIYSKPPLPIPNNEYSSYGYNVYGLNNNPGLSSNTPKDINEIRNTSQCIMAADSSIRNPFNNYAEDTIRRDLSSDYPGNRHSNGANVLFVDGHIGWYLQSFLISQGNEWWNY